MLGIDQHIVIFDFSAFKQPFNLKDTRLMTFSNIRVYYKTYIQITLQTVLLNIK